MAKLVRALKTGFLDVVGALKCGGRPATVEAPISPHVGGASEDDLFVGEAEFKSVHQVMRIVQSSDVGGAPPNGSNPTTG